MKCVHAKKEKHVVSCLSFYSMCALLCFRYSLHKIISIFSFSYDQAVYCFKRSDNAVNVIGEQEKGDGIWQSKVWNCKMKLPFLVGQ